jgi:hypothetical protein
VRVQFLSLKYGMAGQSEAQHKAKLAELLRDKIKGYHIPPEKCTKLLEERR